MGLFYPKPYKKLCRDTGKWITVIPEPIEFNETKKYSERNALLQIRLNEKYPNR